MNEELMRDENFIRCSTMIAELLMKYKSKEIELGGESKVNCTPFVRQYDILSNKWGVLLCQKEYQTNGIHQNLNKE